jgi:hypothetical protein
MEVGEFGSCNRHMEKTWQPAGGKGRLCTCNQKRALWATRQMMGTAVEHATASRAPEVSARPNASDPFPPKAEAKMK